MPPNIFNTTCTIKRATSTGRDSLNNPNYGNPVSGAGWATVYSNVPCKFAFSMKELRFSETGGHPDPGGIMYVGASYTILPNDRVITSDVNPIEYVVVSVVPAYLTPTVISHFEIVVHLPV